MLAAKCRLLLPVARAEGSFKPVTLPTTPSFLSAPQAAPRALVRAQTCACHTHACSCDTIAHRPYSSPPYRLRLLCPPRVHQLLLKTASAGV